MVNAIKPVYAFAAADGNRTRTDFTPQDFKSCASACSATAAYKKETKFRRDLASLTTQMRLELTTSAVTGRRSNQLSHWAILKMFSAPSKLHTCYHNDKSLSNTFWSSPPPISSSQLRTLLHFHLCPIYLVVFKGGYFLKNGSSHLEGGFTLRCLQRLSLPGLATRL